MPPSPAPDARAIAERLTQAQRRALIAMPAKREERVYPSHCGRGQQVALRRMIVLGLTSCEDEGVGIRYSWWWHTTNLGLAVRAELLAMEGRGDG